MLTDLQIQRLKTEQGKTKRYADRDSLVLAVWSSGKKVFLFRFQWNKKPQTITLVPHLVNTHPNVSAIPA
jgi:hypothetical protein